MANSIRHRIITAIQSRLAVITTANAFNTNIGASVFLGKTVLAETDCPFVSILPGLETTNKESGGYEAHQMEITLAAGLTFTAAQNPVDIAEPALADLREAMTGLYFVQAFTSGGVTPIVAGNTVTGATSGKTALVQSVTVSSGSWAGGDAAGTFTLRRAPDPFQAENLNVGAVTNLATVVAARTAYKPTAHACGGLAEQISYLGGGTEEMPGAGDLVVGVQARFLIRYITLIGNPYQQ